ncbi:MAG: hypothetical protein KGO02_11875 [Alphaproteobacteria bacterium]|nr:hypothetical protein [Alphaproteobacteria bacterium]
MTPGIPASARERAAPMSPGTAPARPGVRLASAATIAKLRRGVVALSAAAIALQLALFFDPANLAVSALLLAGNVLGYGYALRQATLRRYPISSLMVLGYVFSYFTLPPLGQLVGLQPVVHHLHYPIDDQIYALAGLLALIGAHVLYSKTSVLLALRGTLRRQFYGRLGFFRTPRLAQLWLMGLLGVVAVLAGRHYDVHSAGITQAVMQGLQPFVYVPYITLLLPAWSVARRIPRMHNLGLVAYSGLLLMLAMVVNSRAYLLMGFASLGIAYGYLLAVGSMALPSVRPRNVLLAVLALLVVAGPVTELSMAMVLVRGQRSDLSPLQLAGATWDTFREGGVSERYEQLMDQTSGGTGVNETYFDNLFLNRLANLKFVDNAVINKRALTPAGADYFSRIESQKAWSILPAPLIHLLDLDADKQRVTSGSSGDFLLYAASGNGSVIGGFRQGSLLVNLDVVFGWLWPLVLLMFAALVFAVVDAWCQTAPTATSNEWAVRFNPLVLGLLFSEMFFFTSAATGVESVAGMAGVLMRGWLQLGVLYAMAFWLSRMVTSGRRV